MDEKTGGYKPCKITQYLAESLSLQLGASVFLTYSEKTQQGGYFLRNNILKYMGGGKKSLPGIAKDDSVNENKIGEHMAADGAYKDHATYVGRWKKIERDNNE